jgi:methylmalonyl-CoA mutase, N-terminal domain
MFASSGIHIESACRGRGNLMGPILDAVRAYATLGEISDVMRSVFGTHQGKVTV